MQIKTDGTFKKAYENAIEGLTPEQAQKMLLVFVLVAMVINILWYGFLAWGTLFAVNVLFGVAVPIEFPQIFAVAFIIFIARYIINKVRS